MKKILLKNLYFLPIIFLSFSIFAQVDDPRARMEAEMAPVRDPATGKIPLERLLQAREEIKKRLNQNSAIGGITWSEHGPNNIGGRTRAIMFDPNDATAKKVWAGGVGGGLWYNTDITNAAAVWQKVDDFWANLAISCIASDPANTQNFYVGTGEGWFNGDAQQGAGIWKSSNGGINWTQLASTASNTDFNYVQKIIVNGSGVIFAATQGGVYKSTDGGNTWTINLKPTTLSGAVTPVNNFAADLEIGTDGIIYASFGNAGYQGSRIFKTANVGTTWTDITPDASQYRTEIALAPSTSGANQVIYAITQSGSYTTAWLKKSIDAGITWTDATPSSSLTGNQAWYDLILAVKPNDPNTVIGGGNVVGRTTNGSTWVVRGYYGEGLHPDHHAIVFRPGFPNEVVHGNDGGVYYSPDYGNVATVTPTFNSRNNGFNVTQYYGAAMKNISGNGYILAGAQDNGTHKITAPLNTVGGGTQVSGGDGMLCFIDQDQPDYQITSYQNGNYYFYNAATNTLTYLGISGTQFVGPSDYNSNQNVLYAEKSATSMNSVLGIGGVTSTTTITHTSVGSTSLIKCGLIDNTVYVGGSNGDIIKIVNAGNVGGVQAITTIATGFAGSVSCVEIGATENELLVTRSNYGIKSVHYTINGGTTWISKDEPGYGLPDIPIRFALFNPLNRKQVLLATELGVFSTSDVTLSNPGWQPTNASLANVSCYMLRYRASDGMVAVATHGRGIYTGILCAYPTLNSATSNTVCSNQAFNYTATTGSVGSFTFAWTRAVVAGISNSASSGSNANVNETLINTTTNPIKVTYLFTISPSSCGTLVGQEVNVMVNPTIIPTVASYSVCQNATVPSGEGLVVPALSSTTINGLLTNASPTYVRAIGNNVTTYTASSVTAYYQTFTFVATASGNTSFEIIAGALTGSFPYDTYMSLYQTSFNPASPATNFLRGDDDSGALQYSSKFTHSLVAGTTYVIVVSTYSSGITGAFTIGSNSSIFSGGVNNWYTAASGGSILTMGEIFNPVGLAGSGVPNTSTIGVTTFYVANALYPNCRTAATFVIGSVGGIVNSNASFCSATNSGTLTLSGYAGTILRWESSTNGFTTSTTIANTTATQSYSNLTQTTKYRAVIQNGSCASNTSTTATITITTVTAWSNSPVLIGGTINLNALTAGTTFGWIGPNSFTSTAQNPTIPSATAAMSGIYTISVTSPGGTCTATATTSVSVTMPSTSLIFVNIANVNAATQNGNSWATAYGNLQTALSLAPLNSEIWVAQGIYKPTANLDRTIAFNIPSGAMLFGGFVGTEATQSQRNFMTNSTVLSGEIGSGSTVGDNSYHVVTFIGVNNSTVLDGFTVTAGNANLTAGRTRPSSGSVVVQPLSINDGGGIGLDNGSSPLIINCKIISNDASQGGGLFATNNSNPTVKNSTFVNNQATSGGATYHFGSNPIYKDILMAGNKAMGGAMYNDGSNPTITNVTIAGNGGTNGVIFNANSTPVLKNSILWGNISSFNDTQSIISYSIVEGGYLGIGNLNLNPNFVSLTPYNLSPTTSGDYQLTNTSPAIDAGDNGTISLTNKDLIGNLRRFNGGIVDIGAYEFQGSRMGGTIISIVSGNWESSSTWNIGRSPLAEVHWQAIT